MAFLIYIVCVASIQFVTGLVSTLNGQSAINTQRPFLGTDLSNARSFNPSASFVKGLGTVPATNQLARTLALSGNGNGPANRNLANSNAATGLLPNVNTNPSLATASIASQNLASNIASANVASPSLDTSKILKPNFLNNNLANAGIANQAISTIANPTLLGNKANSIASKYQLGSSYNSAQSYNPSAYSNYANNMANGNKGSVNRANLLNGWYPAAGNAYSQSVMNAPEQYGIQIHADGLQIAGNVEITGKMPLYGSVSLNGNLPTGGTAAVNYACSD